ncbi:hypothetical protein L1987_14954 [Smallanthus sonchifolius]|uniref:Uncharacterized protein n=1 Tax=Smallanthus sonchifolius TaxID=185202 RepID=A0ACB9J7Q8_9ASTR|nr:hypothetical protein L1987_14954 [Smallanthus sonchifolius]
MWLMDHPKFLNNPLYLGGDSYTGIVLPMIIQEIYDGTRNPATDITADYNSRIQFAHYMALLPDEIYESTKEHCHGDYFNVDPNNSLCIHDLQVVDKSLRRIKMAQIVEPACHSSDTLEVGLRANDKTYMDILPQVHTQSCREESYVYTYAWANRRDVREALHIFEEFGDNDGDHDMLVPYLGTLNWVGSLNLSVVHDWRPWLVDEQVAGYTMKYTKGEYNLTFATVKGGGHTAPEYKHKECITMLMRWLANDTVNRVYPELLLKKKGNEALGFSSI